MIYITQGHELSIGPEVFLKAFSLLPDLAKENFTFIGSKNCLKTQLDFLKIPHKFNGKNLSFLGSNLKCQLTEGGSTEALEMGIKLAKKSDILLTLPTSKDQISFKGKPCRGHTDYFRKFFKIKDISMVFKSPSDNILLISDHMPLSDVPKTLKEADIVNKISLTLESFPKYFHPFDEVLISGLNPHAGEGGLLGSEEKKINSAIVKLKKSFKKTKFIGPLPGDSLHFHQNPDKSQLKVYMYHDQGLVSFKERNGVIGLNISLGLPFLRMSVDHGTAFPLYGKNMANCLGCYYLLIKALEVQNGARSNKNK
jgi:4-hydroxythreonine-4-phosphate dehydrogenase